MAYESVISLKPGLGCEGAGGQPHPEWQRRWQPSETTRTIPRDWHVWSEGEAGGGCQAHLDGRHADRDVQPLLVVRRVIHRVLQLAQPAQSARAGALACTGQHPCSGARSAARPPRWRAGHREPWAGMQKQVRVGPLHTARAPVDLALLAAVDPRHVQRVGLDLVHLRALTHSGTSRASTPWPRLLVPRSRLWQALLAATGGKPLLPLRGCVAHAVGRPGFRPGAQVTDTHLPRRPNRCKSNEHNLLTSCSLLMAWL